MAVVLKATWTANEGSEDVVLDAEPRVVHIFEIYDDEAAVEAHGASEHFATYALGQAIPALESRQREFFETIDP